MTNINLTQLQAFVGVVECGGVNAAAEKIFKSPSTVSHALTTLQAQLGLRLFEQQGRRLHLTAQGIVILKHARSLLERKQALLDVAQHLQQDYRAEISLAVDAICPHELLLEALRDFSEKYPECNVKLHEGVLSGAEEQMLNGLADVCVAYRIPQGFLGERLLDIPFVPVVSPAHPLSKQASISSRHLMAQRQVVIGDTGRQANIDSGWLKAAQRWTVSSIGMAIDVIRSGMAFGWIPRHLIGAALESGELQKLDLGFGGEKSGTLFISMANEECVMSQALVACLKDHVNSSLS